MTSRSTGWSARAIEKAFLAYQSGRLDEAAAECRRLLARDAANAHALHLLGAIALGRGKVKDGIAALERASRLEPSDASIANDLGAAYAALGRWPDAEQHFRRVLLTRFHVGVQLERYGDNHTLASLEACTWRRHVQLWKPLIGARPGTRAEREVTRL